MDVGGIERFITVDGFTFSHERDVIAAALGGDDERKGEAAAGGGRRGRRGRRAHAAEPTPQEVADAAAAKSGIVTDPQLDPPFAVTLSLTVHDFRSLEEESGGSMPIRRLIAAPVFWTLMLMMVCSGAAETAMAQWASDFAEAGLGVSKTLGDLLGTCLFAVLMGVSRVIYASLSDRVDTSKYMIMSSLLCVVG